MARFDVCHAIGDGVVIGCQADDFDEIGTRFVPLVPPGEMPPVDPRLNPAVEVNGKTLVISTQFATAVRTGELKPRLCSLAHEPIAIDTLVGSY